MEKEIAHDPFFWPVIRSTRGVRKARFSCDHLGKRGGGRVWYFYLQIHQIVKQIKQFLGEKS